MAVGGKARSIRTIFRRYARVPPPPPYLRWAWCNRIVAGVGVCDRSIHHRAFAFVVATGVRERPQQILVLGASPAEPTDLRLAASSYHGAVVNVP